MAEVCILAIWYEVYTSSDKFIYEITNDDEKLRAAHARFATASDGLSSIGNVADAIPQVAQELKHAKDETDDANLPHKGGDEGHRNHEKHYPDGDGTFGFGHAFDLFYWTPKKTGRT